MSLSRQISNWKINNPGKIPDWPKRLAFKALRATQQLRCMPDYCIIGAQKSGTTSLYSYLALHPQVKPSHVKEIHYYNDHYVKGRKWYRAHFPIGPIDRSGRDFITGEASTMYLHDVDTPARMLADVPDIKLMLVLRNPVDRAISHYHHRIRSGRETRSVDEAFETALIRAGESDFESGTETDYLAYGAYAKYIEHWLSIFPENQFLVMQAEAFFEDAAPQFEKVSRFLDIDFIPPEESRKFNAGAYDKKSNVQLRRDLEAYFKPLNESLYTMALVDFRWNA